MPECTAARADRFSATLARLILTCAVLLAAWGIGAYILRAAFPGWGWACVGLDALILTPLLLLRTLAARPDPRLWQGWR